jgi:hypothetical protein
MESSFYEILSRPGIIYTSIIAVAIGGAIGLSVLGERMRKNEPERPYRPSTEIDLKNLQTSDRKL